MISSENGFWHFTEWRQFAWNVKSSFLEKNKQKQNQFVVSLISPESGNG